MLELSESLPVGTPIINLVATDEDFGTNGQVNYAVASQSSGANNNSKSQNITLSALHLEIRTSLVLPLDILSLLLQQVLGIRLHHTKLMPHKFTAHPNLIIASQAIIHYSLSRFHYCD